MLVGTSIVSLLGLLALGLVALLCVLEIWRAVSLPPELPRATSCGGCGHEISTLGDGRCPECGGLILKVGLATPRMVVLQRSSLLMAVVAWTILVGLATIVVGSIIGTMSTGPVWGTAARSMTYKSSGSITPTRFVTNWNASTAYDVKYTIDATIAPSGSASGDLSLVMSAASGPAFTAEIDLATRAYTITDEFGNGVSSGPNFDLSAADALFVAAGRATVNDPSLTTERDELVLWVREAARQPLLFGRVPAMGGTAAPSVLLAMPTSTSTSIGGGAATGGPGASALLIVVAVTASTMLLVYLGGILFIIERRRRLMAR